MPKKEWATDGTGKGKDRRIINSLLINPDDLEAHNNYMLTVYEEIAKNETRYEEYMTEDAEIVLTAYGTVARIAKSAVNIMRANGMKVGLIRPITVYPFPNKAYKDLAEKESVKEFVCVELSVGQMIEDVKLATEGKKPVKFFGRNGGNVMSPEDIVAYVTKEA